MRQYLAGRIRNITLAGHSGSGKTSLAEAMLYKSGETERLGKIADGTTVCDYDQEEIKRKISTASAVAPLSWGSTKINLLDTPGLFDFAGGLYECINPSESFLITVCAKSGVEVGTEIAYKQAKKAGKATMFFITKSDVENANFYKVFEELKATFGPSVCPIVAPYIEDNVTKCYVNLIDMKAYTYDSKGNAKEVPMPDFGHRLEGLRVAMSEAIAETDEELFEKYFSGEKFTRDEIIKGLRKGVDDGVISPLLCGSTQTLEGIDVLLDNIVDLLPSPWEKGSVIAENLAGNPVEITCTDEAPLCAYIFKTIADPFVGKMSFFKVISGKITPSDMPVNARTGETERIGKLLYVTGKKQEETMGITAGDIGVITKLNNCSTGDTLCDASRVVSVPHIKFPKPTFSMALVPKNKGDEGKVAQGILKLMQEDRSIDYENNVETKQQLLKGLGEQHLDIIITKLKNKFGAEVTLVKPRVPYRETIRKKVKVEGKHKKQTGGHGQYGHVWIEFEPCDSEGLVFEEKIFGGSVPKGYFPAVEKGLSDCIEKGVLAGYPVVGLKATLLDGSYHPVDSSEMAFKMAASLAYKAGMPQANPVLLEPIGTLNAIVPDTNTGDLMGELNKRRGRILGMNPTDDGMQEITADIPLSETYDLTTFIRSVTQGRGSFTLEFARYEQLPNELTDKVVEEAKSLFEKN